jgi:hypothetical protein
MKISKSKRTIRNRMDREISIQVRARGKCERCGKTEQLQCCHIFSRRYSKMRHLPLNLLCLCAGCHFWSHHNPVLFTLWVKEYLGEGAFEHLISVRNDLTKS